MRFDVCCILVSRRMRIMPISRQMRSYWFQDECAYSSFKTNVSVLISKEIRSFWFQYKRAFIDFKTTACILIPRRIWVKRIPRRRTNGSSLISRRMDLRLFQDEFIFIYFKTNASILISRLMRLHWFQSECVSRIFRDIPWRSFEKLIIWYGTVWYGTIWHCTEYLVWNSTK